MKFKVTNVDVNGKTIKDISQVTLDKVLSFKIRKIIRMERTAC